MTEYVNMAKQTVKLYEGWMDHMSKNNQWSHYWCVLMNDIIYFFKNERVTETPVGTISLGPESRLEKHEGNENTGYRFTLSTARRFNQFKVSKYSEREMWRAFIVGLTLGVRVPDDIELLPGQIQDVLDLLKQFFAGRQPALAPPIRRSSVPNIKYAETGFDSASTPEVDSTGEYLVPLSERLIFFPDPRKTHVPSWYFSDCSRELAEKILTVGASFGNTLMRKSTNCESDMVISKKLECLSGQKFCHYKLHKMPEGYKIEVENPHKPMKTLSEVMNFFVTTSGKMTTHPMKCNNLKELGIQEPDNHDYNKHIVTSIRDADSGEDVDAVYYEQEPVTDLLKFPSSTSLQKKDFESHHTMGPRGGRNLRSASSPSLCLGPSAAKSSALSVPKKNKFVTVSAKSASLTPSSPPVPDSTPLGKKSSVSYENSAAIMKINSTQFVSTENVQPRKLSPKHSQSAGKADNLSEVAARINRNRQHSETEPANVAVMNNECASPSGLHESFRNKLEGLLGNKATPTGPMLKTSSSTTSLTLQTSSSDFAVNNRSSVYESVEHKYQNSDVF